MRSAVVELGTVTLRASVVEAGPEGTPLVHADHRVVLGLERALRRSGELGQGRLELVAETLRRARQVTFQAGAQRIEAVIAAGLRDAPELPVLVATAAVTLDVEPEVRTRSREAELVLLAAGQAAAGPSRPGVAAGGPATLAAGWPSPPRRSDGPGPVTWLLDLGPYELRLFQTGPGGDVVRGAVLALGTEVLRPPASVDPSAPWVAARLRREVARGLAPIVGAVRTGAADVEWLLAGPTAAALGVLAGSVLTRDTLRLLGQRLLGASPTQRLLVPAVDPTRADELAVGAVLVTAVLDHLDVAEVRVTAAEASDGQLVAAIRPVTDAVPLAAAEA
jgi:exopolyphosphatase / guanosine-5'-triphosphate,3'-diphosphate pyrophosphatase